MFDWHREMLADAHMEATAPMVTSPEESRRDLEKNLAAIRGLADAEDALAFALRAIGRRRKPRRSQEDGN